MPGSPALAPPTGHAGTFARAFRQHYGFVCRMLAGYGVSHASVEDAAQDVFLVVHRRWDVYDGRASFRNWLLGIVRRVASDHRRAAIRRRDRDTDLGSDSDTLTLEDRAADRELLRIVDDCIARLDVRIREVFIMSALLGMTAPEIAEALGIKLNTVYSRLRLGRRRFERHLERHRRAEERGRRSG